MKTAKPTSIGRQLLLFIGVNIAGITAIGCITALFYYGCMTLTGV